jgi:predicted ATP-grasp superfamily ATP-dependent carboligase
MTTVVVTDASSYKAIIAASALTTVGGVSVVGVDTRPLTRHIHSKWFSKVHTISPLKSEGDGFCADLLRVCEEEDASHLLPINSSEMRILLPRAARFGLRLAAWGDYNSFATLDNKARLHRLAAVLGVRAPRQAVDRDSIAALLPVVLKPTESSSSRGVRYVSSMNEISDADIEGVRAGRLIAQERILGDGVGLSVLCIDGEVVAHCGHRRIAEWPASGGSSTVREYFFSNQALADAQALVRATRWSGLAMFEFKLTLAGELVLIECNPRIWGSIGQSLASGVNFPAMLLSLVPTNASKPDPYAETKMSPMCWASVAAYLLHGRLGKFATAFRASVRARPDVGMVSDPAGYMSMLLRMLART